MPTPSGPLIPQSSRRAKRIIDSSTPPASEDHMDIDPDAEGEDDDEILVDNNPEPEPSNIRIKLNLKPPTQPRRSNGSAGSSRPSRGAAVDAKRKTKKVARVDDMESEEEDEVNQEIDELDDDEEEEDAEGEEDDGMSIDFEGDEGGGERGGDPAKLTARQRARGNKDLQETLIALPSSTGKKPIPILTEAEKERKREELARKRKRQTEQKLQDEQEQVISRLLRSQTTKSRSKLDLTDPDDLSRHTNTNTKLDKIRSKGLNIPKEGMIRFVSRLNDEGGLEMNVGVPLGREGWLDLDLGRGSGGGGGEGGKGGGEGKGVCAVGGCGKERVYRCVKRFEVGGCCLAHLKVVEREVEAGVAV